MSGLAAGDPSAAGASNGSGNGSAEGSGGSLPFTGGNGRDLVFVGAGLVVLGRVLYELRRVGGAPERRGDEPPQTTSS